MKKEDLKKIIENGLYNEDNKLVKVNIYENKFEGDEYTRKATQTATIYKEKFDEYLDNLLSNEQYSAKNFNQTDMQAEMLINMDTGRQYFSPIRLRHLLEQKIPDVYNNLNYSVTLISLEFLFKLFLQLTVDEFYRNFFIRYPRKDKNTLWISERYVEVELGIKDKKLCDTDIYELVTRKLIRSGFFIAKIEFLKSSSQKFAKDNLLSFIFNMNLKEIKVRPSENWRDFLCLRDSRHKSMRIEDVETPCKRYSENLLHLYSAANWSDNPFTQYMGYYQILENFFTEIPQKRLIGYIREEITNPKLSYKNDDALYKFGKEITKMQKTNDKEEGQLKETLLEFVKKPNELIEDNLKEYYKNEIPQFIDEKNRNDIIFDLDSKNTDKVIRNMCKRIYIVRNALVHNKSGRENNYDPSKHYSSLKKEIPLIRTIAENAIIYSSNDYI